MKKTIAIIAIMLLLAVGVVTANRYSNSESGKERSMHREEMHELMESGTYSDLVDVREKTGFDIKPWIQNQEYFGLMQEMHERMEQWHEENGNSWAFGMHREYGLSDSCPMSS